jgi:L-seryl-tRNA(Ser) seleniumtransferase
LNELLRQLPQNSALLDSEPGQRLVKLFGRKDVVNALRDELQRAREGLQRGTLTVLPAFTSEPFFERVSRSIEAKRRASLRPVINATGVIIHTGLGRAPLAPEAQAAVQVVAETYSNLELDLATGERGSRYEHVETLICELTGAEAAIVVNNGAAAVLVCLMALAQGRDVIGSRGELIEIGGAFRLPDVIVQSGARLKEVGTTNRTHLADYERAIGLETALLLKSHPSNFRIVGFTAAPSRRELADLAHGRGLPLMEDVGSGVLIDLARYGLPDEPTVSSILASGVDIVTFSGDKLLGGPQAGVIAGRRRLVDPLKRHPLLRALRIDKLSLAALEATLRLYQPPSDPMRRIPVLAAIAEGIDAIAARAETLAHRLSQYPGLDVAVAPATAYVGGGSLPQQGLASFAVALRAGGIATETFANRLRVGVPTVVGRKHDDRVFLDMRTVSDADLDPIGEAVRHALIA